ncbi:hypothetical protein [Pseudonocardia sp. HH130630-07]|uniref:hypothetical protein n=1 Tax=Pseudonocardia sp. HH130630-07 TaxID=1690815 RepID=UPI000AF92BAF
MVTLTSGGHRLSDIRWEDPDFARGGYDDLGLVGYGQSKTANILFTVELDRRYAGRGIRAFAVHPGVIAVTGLGPLRAPGEPLAGDDGTVRAWRSAGLFDDGGAAVVDPANGTKTIQQGASTTVFAATSPLLDGRGGLYLADNDVAPIDPDALADPMASADVAPHAVDPGSARRLWEITERMLDDDRAEVIG